VRYHSDHAFWVLPAEPVQGAGARSGLIRTLLYNLCGFKIERPVNDLVFVSGAMNFRTESDDFPGAVNTKAPPTAMRSASASGSLN